MENTIALTGATGFIGNRVARRLVANGCRIQALTRTSSDRSRLTGLNINWVEGALEDIESLKRLVSGVDAVVHCAGVVRGATQAHFDRSNVDGVARLVQAVSEQHPVPRFLLISSLAAREPQISPHASSKRQGEVVLTAKSGQIPWTVFRPPAVYGPGDREMLPLMRWMARGIAFVLGSGDTRFSMLYVDDLAEAIRHWLLVDRPQEKMFELHDGHPNGYSWQDVIGTFKRLGVKRVRRIHVPVACVRVAATLNFIAARALGYKPMLTPAKLRELTHPNWVCENSAITSEIGWTPHVTLEDGLRRTLEL
ncbi:MAG: NAD-dependent epimerase/dehydratase family protein [Desulfobacterales bacterium]|jgi:nucleoside-diphosphate-sugar epimerase